MEQNTSSRGSAAPAPARSSEVFLVLMEFDQEYERLKADRRTFRELETYVSNKHDSLLQRTLEPGSYKKRFSWMIVDGFVVETSADQAQILRCAEGVRVVEKDQELKEVPSNTNTKSKSNSSAAAAAAAAAAAV